MPAPITQPQQGITYGQPTLSQPGAAVSQATGSQPQSAPMPTPNFNLQPQSLSQYFPNGLPQSMVNFSPQSFMSALNTYLSPMFAQQQGGLQAALANAGIYGGSTAGAEGALASQQQQQEQGLAGNDLLSLLGLNLNQSEFNVGNQMQGGEFDISNYNNAQDYLAGMQNQDYLAQMGLYGQFLQGEAGSQNPVYQSPGQVNLSGAGSGLGEAFTPPYSQPPPYMDIPFEPGVGLNPYDPNYGLGPPTPQPTY